MDLTLEEALPVIPSKKWKVPLAHGLKAHYFGAIFINKLDIRLFGYSISERARAPIPREKRTEEYLSIADGLRYFFLIFEETYFFDFFRRKIFRRKMFIFKNSEKIPLGF